MNIRFAILALALLWSVSARAASPSFTSFSTNDFALTTNGVGTNAVWMLNTRARLAAGTNVVLTYTTNATTITARINASGGGGPASETVGPTNVVYVAKNGDDGTGERANISKPFLTVTAATAAALPGDMVWVFPGAYSEQLTLTGGVNFWFELGATLSFNDAGDTPLITDGGNATTNVIDGFGTFERLGSTGPSAYGLYVGNADSDVTLRGNLLRATSSNSKGAQLNGANHKLFIDIYAGGAALQLNNALGAAEVHSAMSCTNDYGLWVADGSMRFTGTVLAQGNSAMTLTGSSAQAELWDSSLKSTALYGIEDAGGISSKIRNTVLESTRAVDGEGNAISKYGGGDMELDNVQLIAGPGNTYSIDNQASVTHGTLKLLTPCYMNAPINPAMNITPSGYALDTATGYVGAGARFKADDGTWKTAGDTLWELVDNATFPGNTNLQPKSLTMLPTTQVGWSVGTNSFGLSGYLISNSGAALVSLRDTTKSEPDTWEIWHGSTASGSTYIGSSYLDAYGSTNVGFLTLYTYDGLGNASGVRIKSGEGTDEISLQVDGSTRVDLFPGAADGNPIVLFDSTIPHATGNLMALRNLGTNIFTVAAVSGYTGSGANFLSDDGTYKAGGSGATINPTDGYLPYRQNGTTFGDSPIKRDTDTAVSIYQSTNIVWELGNVPGNLTAEKAYFTDDDFSTAYTESELLLSKHTENFKLYSINDAFQTTKWEFDTGTSPSENLAASGLMLDRLVLEMWPSKTAAAPGNSYLFDTYYYQTNITTPIFAVANNATNQFQVHYDGSVSTSTDTNRWVLKGVTIGAATNITININGTNYTFQAW